CASQVQTPSGLDSW
nr:immunoglobulin heavy chain junction region [Macaca mulatta]